MEHINIKEIKEQMQFILSLTKRLDSKISSLSEESEFYKYRCNLPNYTRLTNDIIQIRTELNDLKKLI